MKDSSKLLFFVFILFFQSHSSAAKAEPKKTILVSHLLFQTPSGEPLLSELLQAGAFVKIIGPDESQSQLKQWLETNSSAFNNRVSVVSLPEPWDNTLWTRDWTPFQQNKKLVYFNYFKMHISPPKFLKKSAFEVRSTLSAQFPEKFSSKFEDFVLEGGNFFKLKDGNCLTSARVLITNVPEDQTGQVVDPRLQSELTLRSVQKKFTSSLGCSSVTVFPWRQNDLTQHVDMWLKPLPTGEILVADISNESLTLLEKQVLGGENPVIGEKGETIFEVNKMDKIYFDEQALQLERRGYKVIRVPAPARGIYQPSYVNGLILGKTYIAPLYDIRQIPNVLNFEPTDRFLYYPDAQYFEKQRAAFEKELSSLGYMVRWVPADHLISLGGAIHCATKNLDIKMP